MLIAHDIHLKKRCWVLRVHARAIRTHASMSFDRSALVSCSAG